MDIFANMINYIVVIIQACMWNFKLIRKSYYQSAVKFAINVELMLPNQSL